MMRWIIPLLAVILFSLPTRAESPVTVETFTLENGMEAVVIPNHRVPAVSHMLWFRIGSADEPRGYSGLAHYLEHMLFKGTDKLGIGEYSQIMAAHGGAHNAFTGTDYTGYYVNIAKEHLPMVMEIEADRMVNLKVDDQEFLKEREVIMEERSMRLDNQPDAVLREQMMATLFRHHPYGTSIIGWRHEMEALSKEQVFDMYRRYYHPNNMVLVVAGDITAQELKPLAEKYYGALEKGEDLTRGWAVEPPQRAERRVIYRDHKVMQPTFSRYYHAPSYVEGDTQYAMPLSLFAEVLGGSQTSRLYQSLVVDQKVATSAGASYNGLDLGPSIFYVYATPADGVTLEELEAAIDEVMHLTITNGVTPQELQRAKTLAKAEVIYARDGLQSLAYLFGQLWMVGLDAEFFNSWPEKIEAIAATQLTEAAKAVLVKRASVTGWLLPEDEAAQQAQAASEGDNGDV